MQTSLHEQNTTLLFLRVLQLTRITQDVKLPIQKEINESSMLLQAYKEAFRRRQHGCRVAPAILDELLG